MTDSAATTDTILRIEDPSNNKSKLTSMKISKWSAFQDTLQLHVARHKSQRGLLKKFTVKPNEAVVHA